MKRFTCILLVLLLAVPAVFSAEETEPSAPEDVSGDFSVIQTESSVIIIPDDPDTYFEYAIVAESEQNAPKWIAAGSAAMRGDTELTERFPPRSVPYEIWVRARGGTEIVKRTGYIALKPKLMLDLEKIGPFVGASSGTTFYISYDGGSKWETHAAKPNSDLYIDLAKKIGKKEIQYVIRRAVPVEEEGKITLSPPEDSVAVMEGIIQPRPALTKAVAVSGFAGENYPENWTLTGADAPLEYSANDGVSWSPFDEKVGLPLLTVADQAARKKAASYSVRIASDEASGTPASAPKRYKQIKQVKAPKVKPDYKRETAKLKEGMLYAFGEADANVDALEFVEADGAPVSIEEAITKGQVVYIFTAENGKKSRSALQTMTLAPRAVSPDEGEGLVPKKSSVSVQKGFEYFGSKEKWGSFTKGDTEGLVRRKATAKYNTKTNINTGYAASRPVKCTIAYSEEAKGTPTITIEPKKSVPVTGWELTGSIQNGKIVNDSFGGKDAAIEADEVNSLVSLSVKPKFEAADEELVASVSLSLRGKEILPGEDGGFELKDLRPGEIAKLEVTPKDRDTYRLSEASLTVVMPAEKNPPLEVTFGSSDGARGNFGMVTVSFKPIALAQSRTLWVELIVSGEVAGKVSAPAVYSSEFIGADAQTLELDLRAAMRSAGPETFELRAYFAGGANSSDSAHVTAEKTFEQKHFSIWEVETDIAHKTGEGDGGENEEEDDGVILPGDTLKVTVVRDAFGNDLLPAAAFQWWRSSSSGGKGSPIPGEDGGYASSFTVPEDGSGRYYSVEIGVRDIEEIYLAAFNRVD